jgi:hypothetical protein
MEQNLSAAGYSSELFRERAMSAFMLYVAGFIILLFGLIYAAFLVHVPQVWIVVGTLIIAGIGVMSAVSHTKRRDPPSEAPPPT